MSREPGASRRERTTKETAVRLSLDLGLADAEPGTGSASVATGDAFLDHMLTSFARHGAFGLDVRAEGDLHHHLVEDVAIVLGQAFHEAFGGAPCARLAHDVVSMDDVLLLAAVDLVDRPYYEGRLLVPMWEHFFRSFATEARINLHLLPVRGRDPHHQIEAAFKATARALRYALAPRREDVSTKGVAEVMRALKGPGP